MILFFLIDREAGVGRVECFSAGYEETLEDYIRMFVQGWVAGDELWDNDGNVVEFNTIVSAMCKHIEGLEKPMHEVIDIIGKGVSETDIRFTMLTSVFEVMEQVRTLHKWSQSPPDE